MKITKTRITIERFRERLTFHEDQSPMDRKPSTGESSGGSGIAQRLIGVSSEPVAADRSQTDPKPNIGETK